MRENNKTYENLQNIVENMNIIFSELKLPLLDCDVIMPEGIILFLESLASRSVIEKNIAEINRQLGDIVIEFRQVSDFDGLYSDSHNIDRSPTNINSEQTGKDKLFDTELSISADNVKSVFDISSPNNTMAVGENNNAFVSTGMWGENNGMQNAAKKMVMSMITLRDNLILRRELIKQQPGTEQQLNAVIDSILLEIANALKQNNVSIIEEQGVFNPSCQIVGGTERTVDEALDNTVSYTLRAGYSYLNEIIRPQEVVIFSCEKRGGGCR